MHVHIYTHPCMYYQCSKTCSNIKGKAKASTLVSEGIMLHAHGVRLL